MLVVRLPRSLRIGDGGLDRRRRGGVGALDLDVREVRVEGQEVTHLGVRERILLHVRVAAVHDGFASRTLARRLHGILGGAADAAAVDAQPRAGVQGLEGFRAEGVRVGDVGGWELGDARERRGGERPVVGGHLGRWWRRLFVMMSAERHGLLGIGNPKKGTCAPRTNAA